MEDSQPEHNHYRPGEGCIPLTPQATRFGYAFPVHVTRSVWAESISWVKQKGKETSAEKRIYDLLDSCYKGMGKALSTQIDMVQYEFKHWFWDRLRPKATKPIKAVYGARLLLDPETEEPWLLIFDPVRDDKRVLDHGEHDENTVLDSKTSELRVENNSTMDDVIEPITSPLLGTTERS